MHVMQLKSGVGHLKVAIKCLNVLMCVEGANVLVCVKVVERNKDESYFPLLSCELSMPVKENPDRIESTYIKSLVLFL